MEVREWSAEERSKWIGENFAVKCGAVIQEKYFYS